MTCEDCDYQHSVKQTIGLDRVVEETIELLPKMLRESFIAAQRVGIRFKEERSAHICREFKDDLLHLKSKPGSLAIQHMIAALITRISLLWEFTGYAELHGTGIAEEASRRAMLHHKHGTQVRRKK